MTTQCYLLNMIGMLILLVPNVLTVITYLPQ